MATQDVIQSLVNVLIMLKGDVYGIIKKLGKRKPCSGDSSRSNCRYYCLLLIFWITGCTSIKKAGLVSGASLVAASVTSAFSSGVTAPLLAGASTAFVTSVTAEQMLSSQTTATGSTTLNNCAESNFWDVVGQLVEMGGWMLILVILIPMILGWILPGPLEKRKKRS